MRQPVQSESIREARAHLAYIVDRAERDGEPTVITHRGREVAAVVSIGLLNEYRILEEREILGMIAERRAGDNGTRYTLES